METGRRRSPEAARPRQDQPRAWWLVAFLSEYTARFDDHLGPDDRFHSHGKRGAVEADRSVESLVVGECDSGHAETLRPLEQFVRAQDAVHEAELRVRVEMDE
jgi:hypothetical protein